jgi:hypothetical protein
VVAIGQIRSSVPFACGSFPQRVKPHQTIAHLQEDSSPLMPPLLHTRRTRQMFGEFPNQQDLVDHIDIIITTINNTKLSNGYSS